MDVDPNESQPPQTEIRMRIRGKCMEPLLPEGAEVKVIPQRFYFPGDVIVIRRKSSFDAHRFLGLRYSKQGWVAITQADNETLPDPAATLNRIYGKVPVAVPTSERFRAVWRYVRAIFLKAKQQLP